MGINVFRHRKAIRRLTRVTWSYWFKKEIGVSYFPYRLWIEPTNKCNLACTMCPNKDFRKDELGFMDMGLFRNIIDQAQGKVHDVNLHHRGEPTLHPKLVEMIQYANAKGIKVKLHTNGTTLTEKLAKELIQSGLRLISFSFDGYVADVYEKIRVRANFQRTLKNIHRFLELKNELNAQDLKTVMEVIEFGEGSYTENDKEQFVSAIKERGLNRLIIKKLHNWAGNVEINTEETEKFSPCTFPWHALVILWDGRVGSCPHDFFAQIIYGDVKQKTLQEIFNSEKIQLLRSQMLMGELNALESPCRECDSVRRQRIMGIPVASLKYLRN